MKNWPAGFMALAVMLLALGGCASRRTAFFPVELMGMIYDNYNNTVDGAEVTIAGGEAIISDIDGRFLLPSLEQGEYDLVASKEGFEEQRITLKVIDPKQVLYIKMTSLNYLKAELETALQKREDTKSREFLGRALALDEDNPALLYLGAIYHFQRKEMTPAMGYLENLTELGYSSEGIVKLKALIEERIAQDEKSQKEEISDDPAP